MRKSDQNLTAPTFICRLSTNIKSRGWRK